MLANNVRFTLAIIAVAGLATVHTQTSTQQEPQTPAPQTQTPPPITADMTPPPAPCPETPAGLGDAGAMLDRISGVLSRMIGKSAYLKSSEKPTGSAPEQPGEIVSNGGTANRVSVDRAQLDELLAEVEQVRAIVKK